MRRPRRAPCWWASTSAAMHSFDPTLDELALLAESAGDEPVARVVARRKAPDAALFVGSGKADEIKALVAEHRRQRRARSTRRSVPAQQRNLERHLGVPVADRTALILEIFARARQEPRRQAAGRTGAPAIPGHAAGAALEPPGAPARRRRPARRPGRDADRARPPHDRRAHQVGEGAAGKVKRQRDTQRKARAKQRRTSASRWSATPTPASRRCSMRWSRRAPMPPTSCSPRSTPRRGRCISRTIRAARCRCPTRSASSATCRTSWSRRFGPRCRRPPRPTCCCT